MKRRARERTLGAVGVLLCMLLACPCALALDPNLDISQYAHTAWRVRDGFTKAAITAIAQTPDGYLWLGTDAGLYRFDGIRPVPWQPPGGEQLTRTRVNDLLVSRDNTLWISTKGLASWKDGRFTQYPELAGQDLGGLMQDRQGTIWVGAYQPGRICAIQGGKVQCFGADKFGAGAWSLYEDRKGNLWVCSSTGLWRWDFSHPDHYAFPRLSIGRIIESESGELLLATNDGVKQVAGGTIQNHPLAGITGRFTPLSLFRTRAGSLLIGTEKGLLRLRGERTDTFGVAEGLSGNVINCFFEDREGNLWIGTTDGLDRFREYAIPRISTSEGLSGPHVYSVQTTSDGAIWIGTTGGLNRWQNVHITVYGSRTALNQTRTTPVRRSDRGLAGNPLSLGLDDQGRLLASTRDGIFAFEGDRFVRVPGGPGGNNWFITGDGGGKLWVSDGTMGLFHFTPGDKVVPIPWSRFGQKGYGATALVTDHSQPGVWLGFWDGGIAYFKNGEVHTSYTAADGLGIGRIRDLRFGPRGAMWAATEGGLSRIKNGHISTLTSKNGLPCDTVHWTIEDADHSMWLYMPCGLVRIARSEMDAWVNDPNRKVQLTTFDESDGVRGLSVYGGYGPHVAKAPDGKIWFSTGDGVSIIDPQHLSINKVPPPVNIEQITADHKTYNATPGANVQVRLPPLIRDLQIDYTALSFVAPEKVLFRYKLEGWDRDWQDVGTRRQAFYSNLPPRNYTFRVKACNNSGVWNEAGASLNFSVDRAYYQTWWFRALCVTVFLALLWALYRWRVQQLRSQEKRLRDVVDTIPAMAFVARPDGYRTFVNKGWVEYTGMTVEQSLGSGWHAAIHPEDLKQVLDKWEQALATGESMYYEARYRRAKDGQYRWFMVWVVGQRDRRGKIMKWFGTVTDIEERKRAEEERKHAEQERERLRQLEDDMAHINRVSMLGEMAASLAHEIKQPIAATIVSANTCVEWLAQEPPNLDRARAAAARIDKYGNRATEIIDRIRSLYKKSPAQRELVDVNGIIEELFALLKCEADRYSIAMSTELCAELPGVTADRVQLQQVFMNLMLNAIEAMKESGGELTVRSQREDSQLLFSVSDTGVGLPTEKVDQIFSAFFTTKLQGSGMGLAISRSIVESHGGRLWASANDGRGATFHFTLPAQVTQSSL